MNQSQISLITNYVHYMISYRFRSRKSWYLKLFLLLFLIIFWGNFAQQSDVIDLLSYLDLNLLCNEFFFSTQSLWPSLLGMLKFFRLIFCEDFTMLLVSLMIVMLTLRWFWLRFRISHSAVAGSGCYFASGMSSLSAHYAINI